MTKGPQEVDRSFVRQSITSETECKKQNLIILRLNMCIVMNHTSEGEVTSV